MNNFTKEELQELLSLYDYVFSGMKTQNYEPPLKNKIQAMIDNYPKPKEPINHKFILKAEAMPWLIKK